MKKSLGFLTLLVVAQIVWTRYADAPSAQNSSPAATDPEIQASSSTSFGRVYQSQVYLQIAKRREENQSSSAGVHSHKKDRNKAETRPEEDEFHSIVRIPNSEYAKAESLLWDFLTQYPAYVPARAKLADLLMGAGKYDESREQAIECLAWDEHNSVCHRALIASFTLRGEFEEVRPFLADCLELNPDNVNCLSQLVNQHLREKNLAAAELAAGKLLTLEPDSVFTYLALAAVAKAREDGPKARRYYDLACQRGQAFACRQLQELQI